MLLGRAQPPGHQGSAGPRSFSLSFPSTLSLLPSGWRPWPGTLLWASACGSTTTTGQTHIIRGQIPLLSPSLCSPLLRACLEWAAPLKAFRSLTASPPRSCLSAATEQRERCSEGLIPPQTLNNTSRFIRGRQNVLQNCLFIRNTKSQWSPASFPQYALCWVAVDGMWWQVPPQNKHRGPEKCFSNL